MRRIASVNTINRLTQKCEGQAGTIDYRKHCMDHDNNRISLWHDMPLFSVDDSGAFTSGLNFVCEIPKYTRKKFEIATNEECTPIKQDQKKGKPREFLKGDIFFNYGCFPRTWEDPNFVHPDVGVGGDNDPLDVCEIGLRQIKVGEVRQVKVLGILCMIDDGEADWKVITIDMEDRWAPDLNDIGDVERLLPGTLDCIREWFRTYKVPDGKPENRFGLDEKFMDSHYAYGIIKETHFAWKKLVGGKVMTTTLSIPGNLDELCVRRDESMASRIADVHPEVAASETFTDVCMPCPPYDDRSGDFVEEEGIVF